MKYKTFIKKDNKKVHFVGTFTSKDIASREANKIISKEMRLFKGLDKKQKEALSKRLGYKEISWTYTKVK